MEFKLSDGDNKSIDRYIAASDHFKNAEGWSKTCGFTYMSAGTKEEFNKGVEQFLGLSDKPILFELFVKDKDDYAAFHRIRMSNLHFGFKEFVIKGFRKVFGIAKRMLRKLFK